MLSTTNDPGRPTNSIFEASPASQPSMTHVLWKVEHPVWVLNQSMQASAQSRLVATELGSNHQAPHWVDSLLSYGSNCKTASQQSRFSTLISWCQTFLPESGQHEAR